VETALNEWNEDAMVGTGTNRNGKVDNKYEWPLK